jgi:Na+-transporting methylmalonyl-CoA/oxaloacetate decarboxylase gamma subunit
MHAVWDLLKAVALLIVLIAGLAVVPVVAFLIVLALVLFFIYAAIHDSRISQKEVAKDEISNL